ncbi:hypothetical protein AD932_00425, partial [Gluconobacter oxydans]
TTEALRLFANIRHRCHHPVRDPGGWGGMGGWGGGFPSTYYNTSCQTTFELVSGKVVGWTMRGDGC